jgi:hypothetical protein
LTDVAQENGNNREVVDEIVALSKKFGIITNYTSFLVTDPSETHGSALQRFPRPMATPMPVSMMAAPNVSRRMAMRAHTPADAQFYTARNLQVIDERPTVRDFREDAKKESGVRGSFMAAAPSARPMMPQLAGGSGPAPMPSRYHAGGGGGDGLVPPPPALSFYGAPMAVTGAAAVANQKKINKMKEENLIAKDEQPADGIKVVDDKTFYMRNGVWVDSSFSDKLKPQVITFGTSQYFDLLHNNPGIAKYLAVGREVIFTFKGHTYKIVATATT